MSFKSARIKAGISQSEAAGRLGVSRISVYNWESCNCGPKNIELLKRIAELYGVTVDELLRENKEA